MLVRLYNFKHTPSTYDNSNRSQCYYNLLEYKYALEGRKVKKKNMLWKTSQGFDDFGTQIDLISYIIYWS